MQLGFSRPKVTDTAVRVFDRALHPELFEPFITGRVASQRFRATVMICEAGHLAQVTLDGHTVAELTGSVKTLLPTLGLREQRVLGSGELFVELDGPVQYHFAGHVDQVDQETFTRINKELEVDARRAFLSHQFPGTNRMIPGPLSVVKVEGTATSLIIHAFHTFPDDLSIVRTQSLFELAPAP